MILHEDPSKDLDFKGLTEFGILIELWTLAEIDASNYMFKVKRKMYVLISEKHNMRYLTNSIQLWATGMDSNDVTLTEIDASNYKGHKISIGFWLNKNAVSFDFSHISVQ